MIAPEIKYGELIVLGFVKFSIYFFIFVEHLLHDEIRVTMRYTNIGSFFETISLFPS